PFEWGEMRRYGLSKTTLRLFMLRYGQAWTFRRSSAVIFLSEYARRQVNRVVNAPINGQVIPHGIGKHIKKPEEGSRLVSAFSVTRPFRIVYVSTVSPYKHHVNVIAAC